MNKHFSRRNFIKGSAAAWVFMHAQPTFALANKKPAKKLVWVFLRGAMDSLHTVVPVGDANLKKLRAPLVASIENELLPLNASFGLHPDLSFMHQLYTKKEMSPVIATATAYRSRSHFDAQDQMESGLNNTNHDDGWLARAIVESNGSGIAISRSLPIAMRSSSSQSETWYPSSFPEAEESLLDQLGELYQQDQALSQHLHAIIKQKQTPSMQMEETRRPNFNYLSERCGEILANNEANCAMLELGGWDTHNSQIPRLSRMFKELDSGMRKLRTTLGKTWEDTLVVVSTEFGRTVAVNGTSGTDHGTASSMFFLGGALKSFKGELRGGEVLGKWPGLASEQLYQNRDLMPTSDVRKWNALALEQLWNMKPNQLAKIFPDVTTSMS